MTKNLFHILAVGPHESFYEIFHHLETHESYDLRYATDFDAAHAHLRKNTPCAILLAVPRDEQTAREALAWLEKVKNQAPVMVLSPVDDMPFYINVMDRGAFDFFTAHTPLEEIDRVLNNAVDWQFCRAA